MMTSVAMITIPAGRFRMGFAGGEEGRPEGPVHEVDLKRAFAIGKFEGVTPISF